MRIGIDRNNHAVYEGESFYGRALRPAPILTPATIVFPSEGPIKAPTDYEPAFGEFMFREDSFDPVAGIRRGRFYKNSGTQPQQWHLPLTAGSVSNSVSEYLNTYDGNSIWFEYFHEKKEQPLVCLGFGARFTIWTVINVEATSTREDLVTLKARRGLGILPDLDKEKIPKDHRSIVQESLEGFVDEVHRSSPISVIDRARDAASQILLAYFNVIRQVASHVVDDMLIRRFGGLGGLRLWLIRCQLFRRHPLKHCGENQPQVFEGLFGLAYFLATKLRCNLFDQQNRIFGVKHGQSPWFTKERKKTRSGETFTKNRSLVSLTEPVLRVRPKSLRSC